MNKTPLSFYAAILVAISVLSAGCGHQPKTIRSARSIELTPSSEYMISIDGLPLEDWPKLAKFSKLQHITFSPSDTTDAHLAAFGTLHFPVLHQIYLRHASKVTDAGVAHLTNFPSLKGIQLIGTSITDESLEAFASSYPSLVGINVVECPHLTVKGFQTLADSPSLTNVSLSLNPLTQSDIENIIQTVPNVTYWSIRDIHGQIKLASLVSLSEKLQIQISIVDKNNVSKTVQNAQQAAS